MISLMRVQDTDWKHGFAGSSWMNMNENAVSVCVWLYTFLATLTKSRFRSFPFGSDLAFKHVFLACLSQLSTSMQNLPNLYKHDASFVCTVSLFLQFYLETWTYLDILCVATGRLYAFVSVVLPVPYKYPFAEHDRMLWFSQMVFGGIMFCRQRTWAK